MHAFWFIILFILSISTLIINLYEVIRKRDITNTLSTSDKNILYVNTTASAIISIITGIILVYRYSKSKGEMNDFSFG
jgi:uncharacterized membrane protein